jgi:pimeloyl-ACP methyl ester carboxylesterase
MGTAQTIKSFSPHYKQFSRFARLVIPEMRCQGTTELISCNSTMRQLVIDLDLILKEMNITKCNIVGFSFGGRVALAMAASNPHTIQRLSITGVPLVRPALGNTILNSWKEASQEAVKSGNLRFFVTRKSILRFYCVHDEQ